MHTVKDTENNFRDDMALDIRVTELLIRLGIPASNKGYTYLRFAIMYVYTKPEAAMYVTKDLYPRTARECKAVKPSSVERACHHAIVRAYEGGSRDEFIDILGIAAAKCPSCSEFIRAAADYLHEKDSSDGL